MNLIYGYINKMIVSIVGFLGPEKLDVFYFALLEINPSLSF